MNLKIIGTILLVILALAIIGALTFQITRSTESQKGGIIANFNNEPHFGLGGCSRYVIPDNLNINANRGNRPVQDLNKEKK